MSSAGVSLDELLAQQAAKAPQTATPFYPPGDSRNGPAAMTVGGGPSAGADPLDQMLAQQAASKPPPPAQPTAPQPHRLPQWAVDEGAQDPWFGGPHGDNGAAGAIVNGMTAGFGDEMIGAMSAASHNFRPFITGQETHFGQDYADVRDAYRDAAGHYAKVHPIRNMATPVFSAPFMGAAGVARSTVENPGFWSKVASGATAGGVVGGAAGFGQGEGGFAERAKSAGAGATVGAATGGALVPLAYAGVSSAAALGRLLSKNNPTMNGEAAKILTQAAADDGLSLPEAAARIEKDPTGQLTLADLGGENSKMSRLGRALVTANTPVSRDITEAVNGRDAAQFSRFSGAIRRNLTGDTDTYGNITNLIRQRGREAFPLYEKAYEGGSIAPFETQLRDNLQAVTGEKGLVMRQIKDIEQNNSGALAARGAAGRGTREKYMALQQQLQAAEDKRQAVQSVFQRAKQDGTSNAPGAVWNPRIQQFLDDPITKQGMTEGLEIQRLEALADGKDFNPAEYAIVGKDDAGKPIVGAVPNMRLLNAVKMGFDKILESYRDPTTLRLNLDQRGRAIDNVRKSFIAELDRLNPDYKAARGAWAGPSSAMDAVEQGQRFLDMDPEEIAAFQQNKTPAQLEFHRIGAGRALLDKISKAGDNADLTKRVFGNPRIRQQIEAAFGPEAATKLGDAMASEKAMFESGQFLTGGSQTANKAADFSPASPIRKVLGDIIQGGTAGFMGGGLHGAAVGAVGLPVTKALGGIAAKVAERNALADPETAATLGKMLMARGREGAETLRSSAIPYAERIAAGNAAKTKAIGAILKARPVLSLMAAENQ